MTDTGLSWLPLEEIGRRVAEIRATLKISQQDLANRVGIPKSAATIGKIESGKFWVGKKRGPDANLLGKIAAVAGKGLDHFRVSNVVNPELAETVTILNWLAKTTDTLRARLQKLSVEETVVLNVPSAEERHMVERALGEHRLDSSNKRRRKEDQ